MRTNKPIDRCRRRLARQARAWVRVLSFQASGYAAQGVAAPAVVSELLEVYLQARELGGGSPWPA